MTKYTIKYMNSVKKEMYLCTHIINRQILTSHGDLYNDMFMLHHVFWMRDSILPSAYLALH